MPVFSSVDQVLVQHGECFSVSMNQFFTMDLLYIYDDSKLPGPFPNEGTYLKLSGFLSLQPPSQC